MPGPVTLNPSIPRNTSGQPVFPSIDLDIVPIADIRLLLSDYFDQCWGMSIFTLQKQILMRMILAERSSSNKSPSIPWEEIISNPGNYYDSERHHFSTKLDHPQNLSAIQVLNLAEGLLSTSVMDSPVPFCFLQVEDAASNGSTPQPIIPPTPTPPGIPTSIPPSPHAPVPHSSSARPEVLASPSPTPDAALPEPELAEEGSKANAKRRK